MEYPLFEQKQQQQSRFFASPEKLSKSTNAKNSRRRRYVVVRHDFFRVGRQSHRREVALLWLIIKIIKLQRLYAHF